jgi:hypothetical protein
MHRGLARKIGCQALIGYRKDAGDANMESAVIYAVFGSMLSAFHQVMDPRREWWSRRDVPTRRQSGSGDSACLPISYIMNSLNS